MNINIRNACDADISCMVSLSSNKRDEYEKAQPQFWRRADDADNKQYEWFKSLLKQDDFFLLVAESKKQIIGFIIGRLIHAPEVYDPNGLTLEVDDFCVSKPELWELVGKALLAELKALAKKNGAVQVIAVCGAHDHEKLKFLKKMGLSIASHWCVGEIC